MMALAKSILTYFLIAAVVGVRASDSTFDNQLNAASFQRWATEFHKSYSNAEEKMKRLSIWIENHEFIERHNQQIPAPSFTMEHNHFSDMTNDEYKSHNKLGPYGNNGLIIHPQDFIDMASSSSIPLRSERLLFSEEDLPTYVNWIEEGAVTEVKNQGPCGSCWSFSAVGAIEGAKFIKDSELVSLSEQMMMDCDPSDMSCEGGLMETAFRWEGSEGGLCREVDYPYLAADSDFCRDVNCTLVPGTEVAAFTRLHGGDPIELMRSVAIQPTSLAMNAETVRLEFFWIFYSICLLHGVIYLSLYDRSFLCSSEIRWSFNFIKKEYLIVHVVKL